MRYRRQITILAPPERVFAVISDLSAFARLSRHIEKISMQGEGRAHWKTRIGGIPFTWDALVTDCRPPTRYAWRSVSGVRNSGSWRLTPTATGTRVEFNITFHLPAGIDFLLDTGVFRRFVDELSGEILSNLHTILSAPPEE